MMPEVIMGYSQDWYPKVEPVIPRVYHEYINESAKENLYTMEDLGADKAYYVTHPETYKIFTYGGARANIVFKGADKTLLIPGSKTKNTVTSVVNLINTGKDKAFVRVHLAIPDALDDALPSFEAKYNMLHFNGEESSLVTGEWNWSTSLDKPSGEFVKDNNWNFYQTVIGSKKYNVYVVTYETVLEPGKQTKTSAMFQVYLDGKANANDLKKVWDILKTNEWDIKVAAEVVPAGENTDPYEAFKLAPAVGTVKVF